VGQSIERSSNDRAPSTVATSLGVPYLLPLAILIVVIATLVGNCLVGVDRLAFRDVSHFYTPLYGYVAERERVDWLPLYNDLDHAGIPLAGETTTALFYPVRRIIFRLIDSPETAIAWYISLHLVLAGITAAWAARRSGATRQGASLAMIAYPLSGPIWFLYTNPPFLVGAAWLPLALGGGFALLRSFHLSDLVTTAAALALMILAGDPQTAIHVILIGTLAWLTKTVLSAFGFRQKSIPDCLLASLRSLTRLSIALVLATLLAAPQIAASIDWAPQSVRYVESDDSSQRESFAFSVAPWHWAELLVPFISGSLFPQYARISHLLPGDGRTWVITLYSGLIPLSLATLRYRRFLLPPFFGRCKHRASNVLRSRTRWHRLDGWDCIAPIGLVFAMGNLSIVAFIRWAQPQWFLGVDDLTLSPYGWLVAWLPGYDGFRYPAKWLVFVPLGITVAASRQAGRFSHATNIAAARIAITIAMIGFMIAASVVIILSVMLAWSPDSIWRSDSIWGPIDFGTAGWMVATSTLAVVCFAKLFDTLPRLALDRKTAFHCLLFLVAIDLWIIARPTLATVNRASELQLIDSTENRIAAPNNANRTPGLPMRAMRFSGRGWPRDLRSVPSPGNQRILIAETSMRNSLFGRWHLADQLAVFNSPTSLPPGRLRSFWIAANAQSRTLAPGEQDVYWTNIMRWLAIDQSWTTQDMVVSDLTGRLPTNDSQQLITSLKRTSIAHPSPMVSWHRAWREIAPSESVSFESFTERIQGTISSDPLTNVPWIETQSPRLLEPQIGNPEESMSVSYLKPGHWNITINAATAGLIYIKQYQDGNFRATVRDLDQPGTSNASAVQVDRCDYLFSAIRLPAGRFEVQIAYSPRWKTPSLMIAITSWIAVLFSLLFLVQPKRPHATHRSVGITDKSVNRVATG
jgi:hypothetical protein